MPTVRERLKRPETYLFLVVVLIAAAAGDAVRAADRQITARAYVGLIEAYQFHVSPGLRSYIRCRYQPTCSEYSRQAVERHGIYRGLLLSAQRVFSCNASVPLGTAAPAPLAER